MSIENIYISKKLNVGPRYVFFKSLSSAQPQSFYSSILGIGSGYVSAAASALHPQLSQNNPNSENLNKIKTYIDFIKQVAENERGNEYNFIKKINDFIKKDEQLQKDFDYFLSTSNLDNGNFDYLQLINLINRIMKDTDLISNEREKRILNNMQLISNNLSQLEETMEGITKEAEDLFDKNYSEYRHFVQNTLTIPNIDNEWQQPINDLIANKINQTLNILSNNSNLEEIIKKQALTTGLNTEEIYNYLYTLIIETITNVNLDKLLSTSAQEFAKNIIENFTLQFDKYSNTKIKNTPGIFTTKTTKTLKKIEVIAMTTGQGLADLFNSLEKEEDKEYFLKLDENKLQELRKHMNDSAQAKGAFTVALREAIKKKFSSMNFTVNTTDKNKIEEQILSFMKEHTENFREYSYNQDFKKHLHVKTTGSSLAEYLSTHINLLTDAIVHGNATKFKTDLSVTITFDNFSNINFLKDLDKNALLSKIKNFMPDMLENYKKINEHKGNAIEQTDVISAVEAYKKTMMNIYNELQQLNIENDKSGEKRQQLLNTISNFILNSISVKDYNFYANQLGFHGGSLGGGSTPENVLNNISHMYELGGITPVDKDLLLFAVLNCSSAAIGSGLKEDLATYLLGGAAMIMFDDGFTAATTFLESIKTEFGFSMASLHLYRLNGKFVPASYIYSSIYNNLLVVYQDLTEETLIKNVQNYGNKVIINNSISEAAITYDAEIQQRWDNVANVALSEISISFIFMAGLLDIFQALPNAFNNI